MRVITINEKLPDRDYWIKYALDEIKIRNFYDKIKGAIDIDHKKIEPYFTRLFASRGVQIRITRAWIHFMKPRASHNSHLHDTNIGVYYLQVPKDSGNLRLDDTGDEFVPSDDQFVVVPKLTNHSITENKSTGIRIALAFPFEVLANG